MFHGTYFVPPGHFRGGFFGRNTCSKWSRRKVSCLGPSMLPLVPEEALLMVDKLTPKFRKLREGEVVVMQSIHKKDFLVCKRVVHSGEKEMSFLNKNVPLKKGFLWIEGDNKAQSFDSRKYGPISDYLVVGVVRGTVWPHFNLFGRQ